MGIFKEYLEKDLIDQSDKAEFFKIVDTLNKIGLVHSGGTSLILRKKVKAMDYAERWQDILVTKKNVEPDKTTSSSSSNYSLLGSFKKLVIESLTKSKPKNDEDEPLKQAILAECVNAGETEQPTEVPRRGAIDDQKCQLRRAVQNAAKQNDKFKMILAADDRSNFETDGFCSNCRKTFRDVNKQEHHLHVEGYPKMCTLCQMSGDSVSYEFYCSENCVDADASIHSEICQGSQKMKNKQFLNKLIL